MLLNERIGKRNDSSSYYKSLSEIKRRPVPIESISTGAMVTVPAIDPREREAIGFNVDYFFTRFTSHKFERPWEFSSNWTPDNRVPSQSHTVLPGLDPGNSLAPGLGPNSSSKKALTLTHLVIQSNKSLGKLNVPSTGKLRDSPLKLDNTRKAHLNFTGKYWRETNQKFKHSSKPMSCQRDSGATQGTEEEDDTLEFKMAMVQSLTCGPTNPVQLEGSQANLRNSRPADQKHSVRMRDFQTASKRSLLQQRDRVQTSADRPIDSFLNHPTSNFAIGTSHDHENVHDAFKTSDSKDDRGYDSRSAAKGENNGYTQTHLDLQEPMPLQSNFRKYLEEQSKASKEAQEHYLITNMRPLREEDCWMVFRYLLTEAVDLEGYSVLNNEGSMNLPNALIFAKEFRFFIINLDHDKVLHGKANLMKTNWLKLSNNVVVPSLRDLVIHCCNEETEVALVLLLVGWP